VAGDSRAGRRTPLWAGPLVRSKSASKEALRLIVKGCCRLNRYRRSPAKHRIREFKRMRVVGDCLRDAALQLEVADRELKQASAIASDSQSDRRVEKWLAEATARRNAVIAGLDRLGEQAQKAASHFKEDLLTAAAMMAAARAVADLRALIASLIQDPPRIFLRWRRRHRTADALWMLRRRRSKCLRIADAPRRISRGRAPPFASTCQL
jgi:hypothetical protein